MVLPLCALVKIALFLTTFLLENYMFVSRDCTYQTVKNLSVYDASSEYYMVND